ncbi:MAG: hypothetical protein DWH91_01555 [Planctomycetota bacterium]|nr:MAG: hypothetical protein DWH91_01555 [Planctomycetota bacterium]
MTFLKWGLKATLLIAIACFGWWKFIRDPLQTDFSYYHPEAFQITAEVDGKPIPNRIEFDDFVVIRFRCPIPPGMSQSDDFEADLCIVDPESYRDVSGITAHHQRFDKQPSMLVGHPSNFKNYAPPPPRRGENVLQFCSLLRGKGLENGKVGVPQEMHLWIHPTEKNPNGDYQRTKVGVWCYRHAFQFVDNSTMK